MKRHVLLILVLVAFLGCESQPTQTVKKSAPAAKDYINEGFSYLQDANPVAAIKSFDEAIKLNPLDPKGYIILGETYMRLQEYDRAVDSLTAASRVAPDQGEIYYLLAVNYGLLGQPEQAKLSARKSVEIFRRQKDEQNFLKSLALLQGLMQSGAAGQTTRQQ